MLQSTHNYSSKQNIFFVSNQQSIRIYATHKVLHELDDEVCFLKRKKDLF